jgi:hypothetical protein
MHGLVRLPILAFFLALFFLEHNHYSLDRFIHLEEALTACRRVGEDPKKITKARKENLISTYKLFQSPGLYLRKSAFICGSFLFRVHSRFALPLCVSVFLSVAASPRPFRPFAVSPSRLRTSP